MIEILIIICLALALFLMLKNFPRTKTAALSEEDETPDGFFGRIFKGRSEVLEEIREEIIRGQEGVVAPSDLDMAQKRYCEKDPEIAKILFEAEKALEEEDLRRAEDMVLGAIAKNKKCSQAYVIIGRVAQLRGSFDDAKEAYKTAIKCNRDSGEAYFGLGQISLKEENYSKAIDNLQRAANIDRGEASWHVALGCAYMEVRQFAKAAKALKRASILDMENKEYRELASEAEEKQRSHSQAFRAK